MARQGRRQGYGEYRSEMIAENDRNPFPLPEVKSVIYNLKQVFKYFSPNIYLNLFPPTFIKCLSYTPKFYVQALSYFTDPSPGSIPVSQTKLIYWGR